MNWIKKVCLILEHKTNTMKTTLLFLGAIALSINVFGQSTCFSDKSDVMTYVIYKTFESKDGNIKSSSALLKPL